MNLNKFFEFKESDFDPIKSFYLKDDLNPLVWDGNKIDKEIRSSLLKIGGDFFESTKLSSDVVDIVLVGSLCNYNWSEKYSDYDIHIIIKYSDINDDYDLVEKVCDLSKKKWNFENDIFIKGFEVEVAIQDISDFRSTIKTDRMGGAFSLMKNKWIKSPKKSSFVLDEESIKTKSSIIMSRIDRIEDDIDDMKYDKFKEKITIIWKKIKAMRQSGLEEGGEFGLGNLIFKFLRRNGYLGKIMNLKKYAYSNQFK